ncbi:hypothetical protein R1sor_002243 [Riccia sorocarpa]|uniref:Uncharacterized protein n=1 Tax=Riccia sorocarpa TaxID=122646 RepID=A0ABD3H2E6_9MARC
MPPLVKPSAEEPPPTEERALPFVEKPDGKAVARINRELRQRMYLMGKRILGHERRSLERVVRSSDMYEPGLQYDFGDGDY